MAKFFRFLLIIIIIVVEVRPAILKYKDCHNIAVNIIETTRIILIKLIIFIIISHPSPTPSFNGVGDGCEMIIKMMEYSGLIMTL